MLCIVNTLSASELISERKINVIFMGLSVDESSLCMFELIERSKSRESFGESRSRGKETSGRERAEFVQLRIPDQNSGSSPYHKKSYSEG